ncbi:prostacyclin synthase [Colletotrichum sojae]|uniref:Prostacyclin synthase n=1 Tax=Colletotrichum sojae TaxID=2175907 RepID=A0A8H6JA56_9PEZI|nr:prostacyclin synthase [Colletotrichum sojae]
MPTYTLPILGGKLYVTTSAKVASSIFQKRTLTFEPLIDTFVRSLVGMDGRGMELWTSPDFRGAIFKVLYRGLSGQPLADLTASASANVAGFLNSMSQDELRVDNFYGWTRRVVSESVMGGFYGSLSPWRDPEVMDSFWTYSDELHKLLPGIAPSLVASKAYRARTKLIAAVEAYIQKESEFGDEVLQFTRDRFSTGREFGMSVRDSAKIEVLLATALANIPTLTYWLLANVYRNPRLLAELREELMRAVDVTDGSRMTLRVGQLKDRCPLLVSCVRETQRHTIVDSISRVVAADTTVSDGSRSYLLRKGFSVQMPLSVLHADPGVWGADPDGWVGDRFVRLGYDASSPSPPGFLPFGGGKHICPGRHLANNLMIAFSAQFLLVLDVSSAEGGPVHVPQAQVPWPTTGVGQPEAEPGLRVDIRRREGWKHVKWSAVF